MPAPSRFPNRAAAGEQLAEQLAGRARRRNTLVLALPRGGVPVAYPIARRLGVPLDVFLVRKLGVPGHRELAFGALATGGVRILNHRLLSQAHLSTADVEAVTAVERQELVRQEEAFRGGHPALAVSGKTVILVDDGVATGSTMLAAIAALRQTHVYRLVVAVPVAPPDTADLLSERADEWVALLTPRNFSSVGEWYDDFSQTSDEEVRRLLADAQAPAPVKT